MQHFFLEDFPSDQSLILSEALNYLIHPAVFFSTVLNFQPSSHPQKFLLFSHTKCTIRHLNTFSCLYKIRRIIQFAYLLTTGPSKTNVSLLALTITLSSHTIYFFKTENKQDEKYTEKTFDKRPKLCLLMSTWKELCQKKKR